jgi:hypothetical protein
LQNHIGAPLLIEAFPGIPKTQSQGPYYYVTKHTKQTHYLNRWTVRFMAQSYNVITISQQIRVLHTELELNWIRTQLNSIQQLDYSTELNWIRFNSQKMRCKLRDGIENLLVNMVLWIQLLNWKETFPCLFSWEWAKQIPVWNCPSDYCSLWNL